MIGKVMEQFFVVQNFFYSFFVCINFEYLVINVFGFGVGQVDGVESVIFVFIFWKCGMGNEEVFFVRYWVNFVNSDILIFVVDMCFIIIIYIYQGVDLIEKFFDISDVIFVFVDFDWEFGRFGCVQFGFVDKFDQMRIDFVVIYDVVGGICVYVDKGSIGQCVMGIVFLSRNFVIVGVVYEECLDRNWFDVVNDFMCVMFVCIIGIVCVVGFGGIVNICI